MKSIEVDQQHKPTESSWGKTFSFRDSRAKNLFADTVARTALRCGLLILTW